MQAKTFEFAAAKKSGVAGMALAASLAMGLTMSVAARADSTPVPALPAHHHLAHRAPVHGASFHRPMMMQGPMAAPMAVGTQRPTHEVLLSIGEGELVTLPVAVSSVWTSNPDVADIYVDNARQIHLFGKSTGEATVFASTADGAVAYAAKIRVSQNISSLDKLIKLAMPNADVTVTIVGQFALLTGTVASPEDGAEVAKLVLTALNPGVNVSDATGLKVGIINRLRTATPLQVNLQVRIAEVSRSLARQIGTNFTSSNIGNGFKYAIGQGSSSLINPGQAYYNSSLGVGVTPSVYGYVPGSATPVLQSGAGLASSSTSTTIGLAGHALGLDILAALNLGEQVGLVTTLAQPNLSAVSGETADFLVGGEFPIPISQGLGAVSIDYKKYGVSLSYTPTVMADGRISLKVAPEVSELSSQGSVTLNGFTVPALTVRRAETTVELGSGQSFMIAGLLQNTAQNTIQKMPGAGDVPVLGALFRSTSFQRGETELVIVITPYLVTPVNDRDIKLPTDAVKSPDIIQEVLGNMVAAPATSSTRPLPTAAPSTTPPAKVGAISAPAGQAGTAVGQAGTGFGQAGTAVVQAPTTATSSKPNAKTANATNAAAASAPGFTLN